MTKVKVVIVALFAVVALSAVGAASASAVWMIGGANLSSGSAAISLATTVHEAPVLNLPALKIKIKCPIIHVENGFIIGGGNTGQAESIVFLSCEIFEPTPPSNCELEGQPATKIETKPVVVTATLFTAPAARLTFSPKAGNEFAVIPFKATNTCGLAGEQPVTGKVTLAAPSAQNELLLQAIEGLGSTENNSLQVGGPNKAFIEKGKVLLRLVSDSKWSVL